MRPRRSTGDLGGRIPVASVQSQPPTELLLSRATKHPLSRLAFTHAAHRVVLVFAHARPAPRRLHLSWRFVVHVHVVRHSRDAAAAAAFPHEPEKEAGAAETPVGAAGSGGGPAAPSPSRDDNGEAEKEEEALAACFAAQDADGSADSPPEAPPPSSKRFGVFRVLASSPLPSFVSRVGCFRVSFFPGLASVECGDVSFRGSLSVAQGDGDYLLVVSLFSSSLREKLLRM